MGTIFDGIEQQRTVKGPKCGVAILREQLPQEDAKEFDRVLALPNSQVPTMTIVRTLRANGIEAQPQPLNRHRKGDCMCGRR